MMKSIMRCAVIVLGLLTGPALGVAQDYPNRPITMILPLGAGGAMDILARSMAPKLGELLGKPLVIENRTGGATVIAAAATAKAAPDGYTLLYSPAGTLTTNVTLFKSLPYDPGKDFVPVAFTSQIAFVLVVNPAMPVHSVAELIAYAKARPGKLTFGSTGTGATPHLAAEVFKSMSGIDMTHIPYKGSIAALTDVVAGHIDLTFTDPSISPQLIRDGKVRALGVTSKDRVGVVPDVPPIADTLPGYEAISWHMLVAPTGTPGDVVEKLHGAFKAVVATPEIQHQMIDMGLIPVTDMPSTAALRVFLDSEIGRWGKIVQQAGIAGTE
jgi:tripartite-type tricarboxylate transporter receptor subunit TctC